MRKIYLFLMAAVMQSSFAQDGSAFPYTVAPITNMDQYIGVDKDASDRFYLGGQDAPSITSKLVRVLSTGALDTTFNTNANSGFSDGYITAVCVQTDGKILVGGKFTNYAGTGRNYLIRLNSNGTLDTTFTTSVIPSSAFYMNTIVVQPNGRIVIGGYISSGSSQCLYRVLSTGAADTTFNTFAATITDSSGSPEIETVLALPTNELIIGGKFNTYNGTTKSKIAKLTTTGALNTTFAATATGTFVSALAVQTDGKILIGSKTSSTLSIQLIKRVDGSTGANDATFIPATISGSNGLIGGYRGVYAITLQPSGRMLIGGEFTTVGGSSRNDIARLNTDGTLDTNFNPGTGFSSTASRTQKIFLDASNNAYVTGWFNLYNGLTRVNIVKIVTSIFGRPAGTLGVDTVGAAGISANIYPNPSTGIFNLEIKGYDEAFDVTVYNALGQLVLQTTTKPEVTNQLDLSNLGNGNYFVRLQNNSTTINKIIVKQ